jgi:TonB-dependent receptor
VATTIDVNGTPTAGTIQQPVNGNGGRIEGAELLFQQAFTFLPGAFNGLGVYFTASYTDSKVRVQQYDNTIGNTTLPGLSRYVGNATLWYSKYGIESRIAYRYRSSYVTQPGDTDRLLHVAPEGIVDFEANYAFPESGNLKGLKLMFQADNLTNQPYETYYAVPAQQGRYELFGRRYWLGASYKFAL